MNFVPCSTYVINGNEKPMRPLARKTKWGKSLPAPQASLIWKSVYTNMKKPIKPVSRP